MEPVTLLLTGLNHRTAPVELREQLAIPMRDISSALALLRTADVSLDEAVILSTCNRVEFYVAAPHPSTTLTRLLDVLSHRSHLACDAFQSKLYVKTGRDAVNHLFHVTAGLDSMILGESEIAAQVKQAYLTAHANGATGPLLNRLFQKALHGAKVIRSHTRIAEGQASIGSVVVTLATQLFADRLSSCDVLLWGAGKAAEATARHLIKHGVRHLSIVNRTHLKAQDLASLCQSGWLSWEQALKHLTHVDIAIVCTQAPHYVIDTEDVKAILPQRGARPLVLIDLAVPRNVDPSLRQYAGIHLYNVDDLQSIAQAGLAARGQERTRCDTLIAQQLEHFMQWSESVATREAVLC